MACENNTGEAVVKVQAIQSAMDNMLRGWGRVPGNQDKLVFNKRLLHFLGEWLYSEYQPFPEKAHFWDRLYLWLNQVPKDSDQTQDQQSLFNFIPWLLFAAESDLISMYRAAFMGPICRWLIEQEKILIDKPDIGARLHDARIATWFGSVAGMDINTFCRVNEIFGQSYRPEFRFVSEFCNMKNLSKWLMRSNYKRIVVVEDMIGTGEQLQEAIPSLSKLSTFQILIVPLLLAPEGWDVAKGITKKYKHIQCEPLFILPEPCLLRRVAVGGESDEFASLREIVVRRFGGDFGFGGDYGTLALSYLNCPDNVPSLIHHRTTHWPYSLFPRATREG
jgi:hypothetical protein